LYMFQTSAVVLPIILNFHHLRDPFFREATDTRRQTQMVGEVVMHLIWLYL